ncbi:carboxymuconolactone decarboxylase family protein [Streptomyces rubellomurinus]|uniref:carboxymuconolactone decarboxylase family protein n=1 Tax=Streptomyces rubellomurinus (strain ATCC 31215) TaxID=359131 RepID=UPI0007C63783|nr:carboxymuconolactone decarboxylase family protein [Streptomyces rubellomurinus]
MTPTDTTAPSTASSTASSVDENRLAKGLAVLRTVAGPAGERVLDSLADIAPDFARLTAEFGYGDIYTRPGLTLTQRQVANIAALTAKGTAAPQLRFHIDAALHVGVTATEIVETITHIAIYAGFPAALNALAVARAAFAARPDLDTTPAPSQVDPRRTSDQRYAAGLEALERIDGHAGQQVVDSLADIAPDFGRLLVEFSFGDVYPRPGLDLKLREVATVAALAALGTAAPQLRVHLHGLLNVGGTRAEAVETIIQIVAYAGFPAALNALATAREVFAERDAQGAHDAAAHDAAAHDADEARR